MADSENPPSGTVRGTCLCAAISYAVDVDAVTFINNCHCVNCRKQSGAAFVTSIQVAEAGFHWVTGQDHIQTYESSPTVERTFCLRCGSRVPQVREGNVTVPAGGLEGSVGRGPDVDIWVNQKLDWIELSGVRPGCEGRGSPEFWASVFGGDPETYRSIQEELDNQIQQAGKQDN